MKVTSERLNAWYNGFQKWWLETQTDWVNANFRDLPPVPNIVSPVNIIEYKRNVRTKDGHPFAVDCFFVDYPYRDVEVWLNPLEVQYSCTYDHNHLYQIKRLETIKRKRIR